MVHTMWFDISVFILTDIASTFTLYVLCTALALHALWRNRPAVALSVMVTAIACGLSVIVLKIIIADPRPETALIEVTGYGFPSGHATGAMFFGLLLLLYVQKFVAQRTSMLWLILICLSIVAIGSSRIFFQVHTLDQVIAGYVLGAIWATALYGWWQQILSKQSDTLKKQ